MTNNQNSNNRRNSKATNSFVLSLAVILNLIYFLLFICLILNLIPCFGFTIHPHVLRTHSPMVSRDDPLTRKKFTLLMDRVLIYNKVLGESIRSSVAVYTVAKALAATEERIDPPINIPVMDVILFGVGDYRVTDHVGLYKSVQSYLLSKDNVILPLTILDTDDTLSHIPMAITHPRETAALIHASLSSLQHELQSQFNMSLHICHSRTFQNSYSDTLSSPSSPYESAGHGFIQLLQQALETALHHYEHGSSFSSLSSSVKPPLNSIRIHVCDVGLADTSMKYNPYSILKDPSTINILTKHISLPIQICPWTCPLHEQAWEDVFNNHTSFPSRYDAYQQSYLPLQSANTMITTTITTPLEKHFTPSTIAIPKLHISNLPSLNVLTNILLTVQSHVNTNHHPSPTGLYMTHWGGLNIPLIMNEAFVHETVHTFLGECKHNVQQPLLAQQLLTNHDGDSNLLSKYSSSSFIQKNNRSLEHISIERLLIKKENKNQPDSTTSVSTDNLIEGEIFTRFLAAPLFFGLISIRQIWIMAQEASLTRKYSWKSNPRSNLVKKFCHDREWYTLLATKQLLSGAHVHYWRWHGFLCRYTLQSIPINSSYSDNISTQKHEDVSNSTSKRETNALVMIHGFGASGSQFIQTTNSLAKNLGLLLLQNENHPRISKPRTLLVATPDLLGFGQSEKPSLTYTQYLWESYVTSFTQEIVLNPRSAACESFVIGGNSIGGYTAMAVAADDATMVDVTASGAYGTGKCTGLILINSAGRLYSRDEIKTMDQAAISVTEATALNLLGSSRWALLYFAWHYLPPRSLNFC